MVSVMILPLKNIILSIGSPVVDKERMTPGHWLGLVFCVSFDALTLLAGWREGHPCGRFCSRTDKEKLMGLTWANPGSSEKWRSKQRWVDKWVFKHRFCYLDGVWCAGVKDSAWWSTQKTVHYIQWWTGFGLRRSSQVSIVDTTNGTGHRDCEENSTKKIIVIRIYFT